MQANTTSLASVNVALTTVIASHIAAGSNPGHAKAPAKVRSQEVKQPNLGEHWESAKSAAPDKYSSTDLRCRRLREVPVKQEFITLRTSDRQEVSRAYRKSYGALELRLNHLNLNSSGLNGSCPEPRDLQKKLQGLEAALINRKDMLTDGHHYRPCIHKGKRALCTKVAQQRDLVARTNEFNDLYAQCSGSGASVFPSYQMVNSSRSTGFSKGIERQAIIDQLEKIDNAKQKVSQAKSVRMNRRSDCRNMEVVQYPERLKQLIDKKGWRPVTQVAYQSLRDDLTGVARLLKQGGCHAIPNLELKHFQSRLDKLNTALNMREKFLSNGKYFKPCTTKGGLPLLATNRELGEHVAVQAYNLARERDHLLGQSCGLPDSKFSPSVDAFFTRTPTKKPDRWGEARQVLPLQKQIEKVDRLIKENIAASEVDSTVSFSSVQGATGKKNADNLSSPSLNGSAEVKNTDSPSSAGGGAGVESMYSYFSNGDASEVESTVRPSLDTGVSAEESTDYSYFSNSDASEVQSTDDPYSDCQHIINDFQPIGPFQLTTELSQLVKVQGLQRVSQSAYESLRADLEGITGIVSKVFFAGTDRSIQSAGLANFQLLLDGLGSALHNRLNLLSCTNGGVQRVLATDNQQRKDLIFLIYSVAAERDFLYEQYEGMPGSRFTSSVDTFFTRQPAKTPDWEGEAHQALLLMEKVNEIKKLIEGKKNGQPQK